MSKKNCKENGLTEGFENNNNKNVEDMNTIPFWYEDPNIIFHTNYIYELFPQANMEYNQMLNSVTRSVILLTAVIFLIQPSSKMLFMFLITLGIIFLMHYYKKRECNNLEEKEGLTNIAQDYLDGEYTDNKYDEVFSEPTESNPFGNVLVTEIHDDAKKAAPPAYNKNVQEKIVASAKTMVQNAHPDQPNIADKLFKGLGDELNFEQSLRPFNSNPSTTTPNDQTSFAEFCYGSMTSCKEGNQFACARNLSRHTNN